MPFHNEILLHITKIPDVGMEGKKKTVLKYGSIFFFFISSRRLRTRARSIFGTINVDDRICYGLTPSPIKCYQFNKVGTWYDTYVIRMDEDADRNVKRYIFFFFFLDKIPLMYGIKRPFFYAAWDVCNSASSNFIKIHSFMICNMYDINSYVLRIG